MEEEVATLAGGCFWCTEAVFSIVKGVAKVKPGYSGGFLPNPTYEQVSEGATGHVEAVQTTFDPSVISSEGILGIFFASHDPTTRDRQGPDVGTQYRSVIFCHNEEQKAAAEKIIEELNKAGIWDRPIVTQIEPFKAFCIAEDYHKDYYRRHPNQQYCQQIITQNLSSYNNASWENLKCPRGRNDKGLQESDSCLRETI